MNKVKNILESLREKVVNGKITLHDAAISLYQAGWTNFIDIDKTKILLEL